MAAAIDPLTDKEQQKVHAPSELWSDSFAKKVALQDWQQAEAYRSRNHDWRYRNADDLYYASVAQRYWEGTRIPRSSLGIYTAFQQIESLLPHVVGAIFGDTYPFDAEARPGTHPAQARAVRDLQTYQLEEANVREVMRRALKSAYLYGNGILELGWRRRSEKRLRYYQTFTPERKRMFHPLLPTPVEVPTGRFERRFHEQEYTQEINEPFLRFVDLRDFYIDPNAGSPSVQEARYCCVRALKTVDELDALRNEPYFKIPDKLKLVQLAKDKPMTYGDSTKQASESLRGIQFQPHVDTTSDPGGLRLEVVAYWTKDRLVWLFNREELGYNRANPYGFISFYDSFYVDALGRFYGLALTDVTESEQRLQQAILNARIDELALNLNPPRIKRRGKAVTGYQMRRRPGLVTEAEIPKEDVVVEDVSNVTQQAFLEVEMSERRAQKITGMSDLAVLGSPTSMGNSANRTATGINRQSAATGTRIQYLVENIEDQFVAPILNGLLELNRKFLNPQDPLIITVAGQPVEIDPLDVKNASVKFRLRGAARLRARQALMQTLPLLLQTWLNPGFLQQLAIQGKTVNFEELAQMMLDMAGYQSRQALIVPIPPERLQQMNQPPPQEMVRMQMQRERLTSQTANQETKAGVDLLREILKGALAANQKAEGGKQEAAE